MAKLPRFVAERDRAIRAFAQLASDAAHGTDVRYVTSRLRYNHLDPAGREMRIASRATVRLDRQCNPSSGGANLQVQLNEPSPVRLPQGVGTTIAQVIVPQTIYELAHRCPQPNVRTHLESVVRSALLQSAASHGFAYVIAAH